MARLVDLTLTVKPGTRGVAFEPKYNVAEHGWNAQTLSLYSHSGTHMDAPLHFDAGEQTIDEISLDRCLGPAWVAKLDGIAPRTSINVEHLGDIEERLQAGDGLLLRSGWSQHVDDPVYYRDNLPRISEELARWCVDRSVRILGVETPSVADVNDLDEVTRIHQILLGGDVIIVEGLTNLDALASNKVVFGALPLKIHRGDGSPCRAFAVDDPRATIS